MAAPKTGNDYAECERFATGVGLNMRYRCSVHGGFIEFELAECQTVHVLNDVKAERARQFAKYGTNSDLEDGTGDVQWLLPLSIEYAPHIQDSLRVDYEAYEAVTGLPTWMHMVREEVAEAFSETEPARLREELLQVAALAVSWIEKLDAR